MKPGAGRWPIIALIGQTNSGKSSLFNQLLRQRRAIVAREAGTTRDAIGELIDLDGASAWLVDTAGVKEPEDDFEATIQSQIEAIQASADIIILLVEANLQPTETDRRLAKQSLKTGRPVILLLNKADQLKSGFVTARWDQLGIKTQFLVSLKTGQGLDDFKEHLHNCLPEKTQPKPTKPVAAVAIVGRPNVGKSSLFNSLLKKQQALVAPQAGTTRDLNRQTITDHGQVFSFTDTAGLRRPGKIAVGIEKFSAIRTLAAINDADVCLLVVEANQPATKLDQRIAGLVAEAGRGLVIVVNKWDLLVKETGPENLNRVYNQLKDGFGFIPWALWQTTTASAGIGVSRLMPLVRTCLDSRQRSPAQADLDDCLGEALRRQPPAGRLNRRPQIGAIDQTNQNPATFRLRGQHLDYIHWSYKRFIENCLRARFDFSGTPIKLIFESDPARPTKSRPRARERLTNKRSTE